MEKRCKKCDPINARWKLVDSLIEKQADVTTKMEEIATSFDADQDLGSDSDLADFLNQKSPSKKVKPGP